MATGKTTTTQAKPKSKGIDLSILKDVAMRESFKTREGYFSLSLSEAASGSSSPLVMRAKVSAAGAGEDEPKSMLVRMPARIKGRLEKAAGRSASVAAAALVEWALDELENRKQVLTIDNRVEE